VTWDYPKGGVLRRRKGDYYTHNFGKSKGNYRYFVVEKHRLCFGYTTYFICCFDFFNKTWNFIIIPMQFSVKHKSIDFCGDFYV
jgi:hypothetical protein